MHKKQQAREVYKKKAVCSQHEKQKRIKAQMGGQFDFIKQLSAQNLLDLLINKYDSIVEKKQQMFVKFNQLILQRIIQIKSEQLKKNKQQLVNFVELGGGKFNDEDYQNMIQQRGYKLSKDTTARGEILSGLIFMRITINRNSSDRTDKIFVCDKLREYDHSQIDLKRLKKDSIEFMTKFVEMQNNVANIINHNL